MDRKPILDLLAEFKAEIINEVEEEIEDEVGEHTLKKRKRVWGKWFDTVFFLYFWLEKRFEGTLNSLNVK